MVDVKYITINGFDFIITNEVDFNGNHYMMAIDEDGGNTVTVLKQKFVNGEEMVDSVKDDDELEMVLELMRRESGK